MRNFARDSAPEKIRKVSKDEDAFVLETGPHDLIEKITSEATERKSALDVALLQNNNVRKKKCCLLFSYNLEPRRCRGDLVHLILLNCKGHL